MARKRRWGLVAGAVALLCLIAIAVTSSPPSSSPSSSTGSDAAQPASYTFREPLLDAQGVTRLEDLRGRPVLIEFWGTR